MAASRKKGFRIPWPFAPKQIGLNADTDLLKLIAMVTMFVDHLGKVCFPEHYIMRIIGRMAFPIYAYCIAVGCVYTRNHTKYLTRLVLLGLISQPLYVGTFWPERILPYASEFAETPFKAAVDCYMTCWTKQSTILALVMGVLVIWTIRNRKLVLTLALAIVVWKISSSLDYGWRGVALMTLMYLFIEHWWISLPVVSAYMFWWGTSGLGYKLFGVQFGIQMFAMLALPLIYIPTYSKVSINKWMFYLFYPAHLIVIMFVERLMG